MTQHEKAGRTIHERSERRKAEFRENLRRQELIKLQMTAILDNPDATISEKLKAAEILSELGKSSTK